MLIAVAYLHDIGYAPSLHRSGFHPLDGALHLRALGHERLARLVAHHSGARWEAELQGLGEDLAVFDAESSVVADALTYCDITTSPTGESVTLSERLADVEKRHGVDSLVVQALQGAKPELARVVCAIETALWRAR